MTAGPRTDTNEIEIPIDQERVALSRVRIRQLMESLRRQIFPVLSQFIWEINDQETRRNVIESVSPVLERARVVGGLREFEVVCDETNNTPEEIDQGQLCCTLAVRPLREADFVVMNMTIGSNNPEGTWGEPEIIRHEEEPKSVPIKYFRKLRIPE